MVTRANNIVDVSATSPNDDGTSYRNVECVSLALEWRRTTRGIGDGFGLGALPRTAIESDVGQRPQSWIHLHEHALFLKYPFCSSLSPNVLQAIAVSHFWKPWQCFARSILPRILGRP